MSLNTFRRSAICVARNISRPTLASTAIQPSAIYAARLNSTKTSSTETPSSKPPKTPEQLARKAALEKQDDLQRDWDAKVLPYEKFLLKTQNPSPSTYIIDVREPEEVIQGMIPSAVNIPLSVLGAALHTPREEFLQKFGFEKPRWEQEVIFYCRSGMRSTTASDVAKRNGYKNILNYKGSWLEWTSKQSNKPVA